MTESELFSEVIWAQDILLIMRILNITGLKVNSPMKIDIENKGEKDITHNWSVGGRLIHVEVK